MIYMRQKATKKIKQENMNEMSKNTVMSMLKNKISKAKNDKVNIENIVKQVNLVKSQQGQINDNNIANKQSKFYVISKNKGGDYSDSQSKISESIIVHDVEKYKIDPHFYSRNKFFSVQKCFDFKINNQLKNHHAIDTYISMLEKEKDTQKQELLKLKEFKNHYNEHMTKCTKTQDYSKSKQVQINSLKKQIKQLGRQFEDIQLKLKQFLSMFQKSKQVMLSTVMQLIDIKNELNSNLSPERSHPRTSSLNKYIQKTQRLISIFSDTLKTRKQAQDYHTLHQLQSTVKYQQKIINLIKQNQNNSKLKQLYHQNALMRYQINRLTEHNQNFLHLINTQQKTIQQDLQKYNSSLKKQQINQNNLITKHQNLDSTPTSRINISQISKVTMLITQRQQFETTRFKLQEQLKKIRQQFQIQKQFLIMQCQSKQKQVQDLKKQIDYLKLSLKELNTQTEQIKNTLQITKQSQKVLQQQNQLLKHKIQYITRDNDNQSVTVEELLNFLNKSELKRYHRALMQLISTYQLKISELNQAYLQEKQLKDHLNTYHRGLNNLLKVKMQDEYEDEEVMTYCCRFQKIMAGLKENRIDIYLRQIKGYTIGIDSQAKENIQSQLVDYIEQLRSRMPALTQEYLDEDGSSVANSSIQRFD